MQTTYFETTVGVPGELTIAVGMAVRSGPRFGAHDTAGLVCDVPLQTCVSNIEGTEKSNKQMRDEQSEVGNRRTTKRGRKGDKSPFKFTSAPCVLE
jgi:hypothetical protein